MGCEKAKHRNEAIEMLNIKQMPTGKKKEIESPFYLFLAIGVPIQVGDSQCISGAQK